MGQIGGDLLNGIGGYIEVAQHTTTSYVRLDVAEWQIRQQWVNVDATHSGCYGAINMRRVAIGYTFACEVIWDLTKDHPKRLLQSCNHIKLRFRVGNPVEGQYPPGYSAEIKQMYYVSPSALLESITTINNTSKDVVRMFVKGVGSSHLFLTGPTNDESAYLTTYNQYLTGRGWTP